MGRRVDPDRIELEGVTATPMRERGTDSEGRRYWRARTTGAHRGTVWSGWGTRAEVSAAVAAVVARGLPARPGGRGAVHAVADLLDRWEAQQERRLKAGEIAELTLRNYRANAAYWRDGLGDVLVSSLTRELVEDTVRSWRADAEAPVSARTCAAAVDVLRAILRWGEPRGLCPHLDLRHLQPAAVDPELYTNESYTPTRAEADLVLSQIPPGRDRDLVELLGLTGARVGEIVALRVGSWDRAARELVLSGRDVTRGRAGKVAVRRWPVDRELGALLDRLAGQRAADEPLIPDLPSETSCQACAVIRRAAAAVQVHRYTPHGLRRLVVLELLDQTDPRTASLLTGHSVVTLLRRYVRPRPERLREVVQRAAAARSAGRTRGKVVQLRAGDAGAHDPGTPEDTTDEG